jgi:hypothetical protein
LSEPEAGCLARLSMIGDRSLSSSFVFLFYFILFTFFFLILFFPFVLLAAAGKYSSSPPTDARMPDAGWNGME